MGLGMLYMRLRCASQIVVSTGCPILIPFPHVKFQDGFASPGDGGENGEQGGPWQFKTQLSVHWNTSTLTSYYTSLYIS